MLLTNYIKENKDTVITGLKKRGWKDEDMSILDEILKVDTQRKEYKTELDNLNAKVNKISKEIGNLYKQGKAADAESLKSEVNSIKDDVQRFEDLLRNSRSQLTELLLDVPNVPHVDVPAGTTDEDNEVFQSWEKEFPTLPEGAKPHWDLMEDFNLVDFSLGVKITGAGFPLYRGKGAKLQRALISFFLDEAIAAGYEEIIPPLLVNEDSARGTGQLPDKEGQMYHVVKDELYLIPTAEVPLTNVYRNDILSLEDLPIKVCGYTPCFRREAGSYGAHVKGLNRVHQFDKIEIVQIVEPEKSYETLSKMRSHIGSLLEKLELPYRILRLCGGDLGFVSAITYDFEVFSCAQEKWLEVSSVSNFESYQSNRMKTRYRDEDGKINLVHTLNGSALALARIYASILENNQTENGIKIPTVLQKYTGFDEIN